jgi:hypothetical protein
MVLEIGAFAYDLILGLIVDTIREGVKTESLTFFEKRKIYSRVENATAEVVEPLLPFLTQEGVDEDKQQRLIRTCVEELRPFSKDPHLLFEGSLNGQKIFDKLYIDRPFPQIVIEDGLKDTYALLCPRIATLLCTIPAAVKDWENQAWTENFRRFDEISIQMRSLFSRVDQLAALPSKSADETLTTVRRAMAQRIELSVEYTGLRGDNPTMGRFDDFFVHPELREILYDGSEKNSEIIGSGLGSIVRFAQPHHRAIVIGPPGAGKSTWARWLQRESLTSRWNGISVNVELRGLSSDLKSTISVEGLPSIQGLVRMAAGKHFSEELTADRIAQWLVAHKVLFILDGYDEIRPTDRDILFQWIDDLTTASRGCPFVVTSRPLTTDHLDRLRKTWTAWSMEPFDLLRVVDYVQRWYKYTPLGLESVHTQDPHTLANEWHQDSELGHLTGNPLLLSTLLMVHHLDGRLPSHRAQLYRRYVEGMLGMWDDRRKVRAAAVSLSLERKRQLLQGFALHLFDLEADSLDEDLVLLWFKASLVEMKIFTDASSVLTTLRERSGLIVGPGLYEFAHKSIGEYLMAETVLSGVQRDRNGLRIDRLLLFEHRNEDRWNTVTFLWAGLAPIVDVESFVSTCLAADAWDLGYGILDDQYERIPPAIRRQLVLQLVEAETVPRFFNYSAYYYLPGPVKAGSNGDGEVSSRHLKAPMFVLRSVNEGTDIEDLVARAIKDGLINLQDLSGASGDGRDLIWLTLVMNPIELEEWMLAIKGSYPPFGEPDLWIQLVLTMAIRPVNASRLVDMLQCFKEAFPELTYLIPLMLINSFVSNLDLGSREYDPIDSDYATLLLSVLPDSGEGQINETVLQGTRSWSSGSHKNTFDLLKDFLDGISGLADYFAINEDETFERATRFVNELIERRDVAHSVAA